MTNNWIKALKEYNKDNVEHWCVPKKGSKNYSKLQKIMDKYDGKTSLSDDQASMKIQSFFKKVKQNKEQQREYTRQAIEKYKNLIPQSSMAGMMKPNPNFQGNAEYLRNKRNEEFRENQIKKYIDLRNSMTPIYMFQR